MFADSLLESSWAQRSRRSFTTLTSFALQAVVLSLLLLLPILRTVGLPTSRVLQPPVAWGPPPGAPVVRQHRLATVVQSNLADNMLITPRQIPDRVAEISETVPPPQVSFDPGVEGGIGGGSRNGVLHSLTSSLDEIAPPPPPAPKAPPHTFRPSSLLEGSIIRRVQPIYPTLARAARIQGPVILYATISKAGTIDNLRLVSGHPMLVPAAIAAVSEWRYRPYILNGEPIAVETQITVNFILGN